MKGFHKSGFSPSTVIFSTLFTFAVMTSAGTYSGGSGTAEDPYKISTVLDWQELIATSIDWDKNFILLNDIDFEDVPLKPIAPDTDPSKFEFQGTCFSGTFDGNHHVLRNITINLPGRDFVGLVGLFKGTLRNLCLEDSEITGWYRVGGLAGENHGTISECIYAGNISAMKGVQYNGSDVGGIAGVNFHGTITGCCFKGNIKGGEFLGGLVGNNCVSRIIDSYVMGQVEGINHVGGLVGYNWQNSQIFNSYSVGRVIRSYPGGGLVGYNESESTVIGFWDIEASGQASSGGGVGKTTVEMMDRKTYVGWGPAWTLRDGQEYPHLAWENAGGEPLTRFSGGLGTAEDPYRISTVDDWQELTLVWTDWDKHFILTNDLDMEGVTVLSVGPNYGIDYSKRGFTGVLNGAGHVIRNLSRILPTDANSLPGSSEAWESNDVGLFGNVGKGGVIRRLGLENLQIRNELNDYYDGTVTGGLVASNDGGEITECFVTGSIFSYGAVGGLVGHNNSGTIKHCYSNMNLSGSSCGGLVGYNGWDGGKIIACYSNSMVMADTTAGGLVVSNNGDITACYSTGLVQAKVSHGMLVESVCFDRPVNITGCFWENNGSNIEGSAAGKGLTFQEMKTLHIFQNAGWAGKGWVMKDGEDYPRLDWEGTGGIPIPESEPVPLIGSGSEADPFQIRTPEDLVLLSWYSSILDKHIVLVNDLDLAGIEVDPIGDLGSFSGEFDGGGHVIHNLKLSMPDSDNVGLFRLLLGQIHHLGIENVEIRGRNRVGIMVGFQFDSNSSVLSCQVQGTVTGDSCIGGLVGFDRWGTITNCYAEGNISGVQYVGGLVGENDFGGIGASFSTARVRGTTPIGGLVGFEFPYFQTLPDFWDINTSGITKSARGTGKTTAEMKTLSTFTSAGWDFVGEATNGTEDLWRMCVDGVDYPRLSWEFSSSGDFVCPDGVGMEDLVYLANRWMVNAITTAGAADVNGDGRVDLADFGIVASNWMRE